MANSSDQVGDPTERGSLVCRRGIAVAQQWGTRLREMDGVGHGKPKVTIIPDKPMLILALCE